MVQNRKTRLQAYSLLEKELSAFIPASRLLTDAVSVLAYGSDASFYRLLPKLVVKIVSEREAALVLADCRRRNLPVTVRAAGTSLSGQALSDSVLLQIGREFGTVEVLQEGLRIRLQPAVIGGAANVLLAPFGRKLGPDPASIDAAMIGGIAANNASGMCCGIAQNCYRTLDSLRAVFSDGTVLDTADPASRDAFCGSHRNLLEGLSQLAAEVRDDADLAARIRRKYRMKNTTGYGLNALVDFQDPFDILQHLLIGSEGTLAFISEITLHTVPEYRHQCAILAYFPDASAVGRAVNVLAGLNVQAVEYMDEVSLQSVSEHPELAAAGSALRGCSALLIDLRAENAVALRRMREEVEAALMVLPCAGNPVIAEQAGHYRSLWAIRKGLFPAIGARRPAGTTILIEDVAFPRERLGEALVELRALLAEHGYTEAILYGHALAGNLHFVFWQDFGSAAEVDRYAAFMEKLTDLVLDKYQGSLKAEHGTGRNMAPFVEKEWGQRAYAIMTRIKKLFDPEGILNPDVILSADKRIHVKNLKPLHKTDPLVDPCTECGFCERVCPSRNATLTPRQRITVWREISRLQSGGFGGKRLKALLRGFEYQGTKTCATDGLCAMKCPVGIDTGALVKSLRHRSKKIWQRWLAQAMADRFALVLTGMRLSLRLLQSARSLLGAHRVARALRSLNRMAPGIFPPGLEYLPRPGRSLSRSPRVSDRAQRVLYFPSCINRVFGPERRADRPLAEVMVGLLQRAGFEVEIPEGVNGLCCGLAFASKGFTAAGNAKLQETRAALERFGQDCVAVVCDTSPCTQRLQEKPFTSVVIQDSMVFLASQVLPRLQVRSRKANIALHPTCSVTKMGASGSLRTLAAACAEKVTVTDAVPCCGVAGDRMFLEPELPRSACAGLRSALPADCREGYSSSRTCEIGLSQAAGIDYRSILYLLDEATSPAYQPLEMRKPETFPQPSRSLKPQLE